MKTIKNLLLLVLPALMLSLSSCSANTPNGDVVVIEDSESFYKLIEGDTPVLVDFYAEWCRPCRIQGPVVEEIAAEMAGDVIIAKLNVDDFPRIAAKYEVSGIPSLILYQSGATVWKKVGLQEKASLKAALRNHLKTKE